jgi:hypothetical protein
MKPAPDQNISKKHVSTPPDGDLQPLSTLAADKPEQHAERFAFTDDDRLLLDTVLASDPEPDTDEPDAAAH